MTSSPCERNIHEQDVKQQTKQRNGKKQTTTVFEHLNPQNVSLLSLMVSL